MRSPNPPAAPTANNVQRVATSIPCAQCGYNLRTLALEGACPECNRPVADSLPRQLEDISPDDARRLHRAALLLASVVVLVVAFTVVVICGGIAALGRAFVGLAFVCACVIGALVAQFIGTAREVSQVRATASMKRGLWVSVALSLLPAAFHSGVWLAGCLVPAFVLCNVFAASMVTRRLGQIWSYRAPTMWGGLAAGTSLAALFILSIALTLEGARLNPRTSAWVGSVGASPLPTMLVATVLMLFSALFFAIALLAVAADMRNRRRRVAA